MRRFVLSVSNILDVLLLADFSRWPMSSGQPNVTHDVPRGRTFVAYDEVNRRSIVSQNPYEIART